ncbi:galactosamine-6-phosphate isomerase [Allomuricauda sp. M10]|uniref:galactosamine-6-phosphate isomerase n=1 Tax=Allomuricauda sp. M10 TaxID=2683292 RepID=UPI001D18BBF3|nr:galactosamine-6-phosphate isomerase [Muricauda sp. M10]
MNIQVFGDYEQMSAFAADIVLGELERKRTLKICAATGNSPTGMYRLLAQAYKDRPEIFNGLHILKLDEWGGLSADHPGSCEYYLHQHLLEPLKIPSGRYMGFRPNPENPEDECERVQHIMESSEPIDLCILGLGKNGHIGFNEPADMLQPFCHVAQLSEESKKHGMVANMDQKPEYGMTLGMQNILSAKRILLLISGTGKDNAIAMLKKKMITPQFPVTFLWLHPKVDCLLLKGLS